MAVEAHEEDLLLAHEYDGIQEFDNPTPGWWHLLFWGSIVFSVAYFFFFQLGPQVSEKAPGWTIQEAYDAAVARNLQKQFGEIGELAPTAENVQKYRFDPKWLKVGEVVFAGRCAACHGQDGAGLQGGGPNMTDDYYKNIKTLADIPRVVAEGAANGAMPPHKRLLHPNEVVLVSSFVANLRGENLPSPRKREGEKIAPWPEYDPSVDKPAGEKKAAASK